MIFQQLLFPIRTKAKRLFFTTIIAKNLWIKIFDVNILRCENDLPGFLIWHKEQVYFHTANIITANIFIRKIFRLMVRYSYNTA
jgi:hypothetical protein